MSDFILEKWWFEKDESSIVIPYHTKVYSSCLKPVERTIYSERFHAITYHILKHHLCDFSFMHENIQFENTSSYYDNGSDFILLPKHTNRIKIFGDSLGKDSSIFFEVVLDKEKSDIQHRPGEKDNDKCGISRMSPKKYVYKLSKPGRQSLKLLHEFLESLVKTYKLEVVNKPTQHIFEFISAVKDDDDKIAVKIKESPFHTNKTFQNIFFERKEELIHFISKFNSLKHNDQKDVEYRESVKAEYKRTGNPYKATIMLYGEPGCGKTSLIKAIVEYTGRHCVLVSWSKIKTCTDFVSLLRPMKIGYKEYQQSELIIVFEDFDANTCEVLKTRANLKKRKNSDNVTSSSSSSSSVAEEEIEEVTTKSSEFEDLGPDASSLKSIQKQLEKLMSPIVSIPSIPDELTLDYILNVLDGIAELYDSIIFFTTNDIESIDPALKRPGRIDLILKMERISNKMIKEYMEHRYNCVLQDSQIDIINKLPKERYSYADFSELCNDNDLISLISLLQGKD